MNFRKNLILLTLLGSMLFLTSCKESIDPPKPEVIKNYFTLPNNSINKYLVDSVSTGNEYFPIGIKTVMWGPEMVTAGTPYYAQIEQLDYTDGGGTLQRMKVRKTERGLYYYLDTTGFSALIPDTAKPFIQIDREITAFSLPFFAGQSWSAFKFNVVIIPVINCTASYSGSVVYDHTVQGHTGNVTAERIKYTLSITIPTPGQPAVNIEYTGEVWYAESLGVVKKEGDYFLFQFLGGSEVDLLMPNYRVRERLNEIIK